ncbi:MAG TPA: TonB-dependent receptor [Allosphingosinicella sp.]|nr:TonB-dependent receptor [Allosphingosinicella sp.]
MNRAAMLTAASSFALLASQPAFAQDEQPAAAAAPAAAEDENDIVVTAQLRSQRLSEVPMAITAYSGEFLEELGLNDFEDVARFVPGFEVQNQSPNNPGFVMRGVTSDSGESFVEPRVSVFQDGVSISKSRGSYVELFDIQRVEIVRGPQSTLYGRGALIGAVNIIQNRADPSGFAGFFEGGYGNFDYWSLEGMLNVPMGETAAFRVSGRYRNRDGFIPNLLGGADFNSVDTGAIRGTLHWAPSERVSVDIFGNYQEDHPNGTSFKSMSFNPTDPTTGAVLGDGSPNTGAALAPGAGFEGGAPLGLDREVWGVTGIVRAELSDAFTLTSISAYRQFDGIEILDADGISLGALTAAADESGEQWSQELRLGYDNDGPVTAFVGLSYFSEEGDQRTPAQFDERVILARLAGALNGGGLIPGRPASDPAPLAVFGNPAFTGALLQGVAASRGYVLAPALAQAIAANLKANHTETTTNFSETESFDIFGDVTFRLSDQFELGVGARYSRDSKTTSLSSAVLNGRSILGGFIGALGLPEPTRTGLLTALAAPGAATIPPSAMYPVPLFGLTFQPTNGNGSVESQELDDTSFTWRLTARYAPSPNTSFYANYARGRRPEVLSALPPAAPFGPARFSIVDAETVDSFEVGARTQQGGLMLDGALFYYRYDNFQTTEQVGTIFVTTNAGEAEAYGFEGQLRWRASPNATLFATYAWNHSRLTTGVRDGNRFRLSPDHTISLGARLGVDVGPGRLTFVPSVTYQSRIFFDDDNDLPALQQPPNALVPDNIQDEVQDGYALVNARLGYTFSERFTIEAFVSNLFDEEYIKDAGNTGNAAGLPTFIGGEPRMYGLQASVRF